MANSHRAPVEGDLEEALDRILSVTHNIQTRIWRISRRNFITATSAGQLKWDAESLARDVDDLIRGLPDAPKP